jgi:hypothetical protein
MAAQEDLRHIRRMGEDVFVNMLRTEKAEMIWGELKM